MKIQVITLFPEMFEQVLNSSMMWKAQNNNAVTFNVINLRDFGIGPRKQVDDTPYGGGDGMLLKPEPFFEAIKFAKEKSPNALVIAMTPSKTVLTQKIAENFANEQKDLIFVVIMRALMSVFLHLLTKKLVLVNLYLPVENCLLWF